MFNIQKLIAHAVLLLATATGAGAALAGPTYHVDVNSAGLGGGTGFLDFTFLGLGSAAPATATVSHFTGDFLAVQIASGDVSGLLPDAVTFGNSTEFNDLLALVNFNGMFSFDLTFDVAGGGAGSTFGVAFVDNAVSQYLGVDGYFAQLDLRPGMGGALSYAVSPDNQFVTITAVPEPSALLLSMTGLGLAGFAVRRRKEVPAR